MPDTKASATVWLPPGTCEDPPPDKRRWNAVLTTGIKPWTRAVLWAQRNPGRWVLLCVSNRPDGITYRLRNGTYGVTQSGTYTVTARSVGDGFARVYLRCDEPPPSLPAEEDVP
jgi:hypothetical protein